MARIKLPKPAMAVRPETNTALPVLLERMDGVCSSAKRLRIWIPLVTPMPITSGRVMMFAGFNGIPKAPISPNIQSVPTATGNKASTTDHNDRKCTKTISAMAPSA